MKPSHLVTPRTLNECQFQAGYVSAPPRRDNADRIVMWGCLFACAALIVVCVFYPEAR